MNPPTLERFSFSDLNVSYRKPEYVGPRCQYQFYRDLAQTIPAGICGAPCVPGSKYCRYCIRKYSETACQYRFIKGSHKGEICGSPCRISNPIYCDSCIKNLQEPLEERY